MSVLFRLQDPSTVQTVLDEFSTLGRTTFLLRHGFGKARTLMVRNPRNQDLCDAKAVLAVAYGKTFFSEGTPRSKPRAATDEVVASILQTMGFEVVRVDEDWLQAELDIIVADYFAMLVLEALESPYNKAEHNTALLSRLHGRSRSSIELKHHHISAILAGLDLPYLPGYKPRGNSQLLLRRAVQAYVTRHQSTMRTIVDAFEEVKTPAQKTYCAAITDPPSRNAWVEAGSSQGRILLPRNLDLAARDEANRRLGRAGEQWVIGYEHYRLTQAGHPELIQDLEWVSETRGDGAGFDIRSFEDATEPRFIEVKTTNAGISTPFVISHNELSFSEEMGNQFYLYRVFDMRTQPRLFTLRGHLAAHVHLKPLDYRASFRRHVS